MRLDIGARGFEHPQRAGDIGLDERFRPADRTVDVALGSQVGDRIEPLALEQLRDQRLVEDRALDEAVARVGLHRRKVLQIARIGQRIEHHHALRAVRQQMRDEIGADEAGAAGDENAQTTTPFACRDRNDGDGSCLVHFASPISSLRKT